MVVNENQRREDGEILSAKDRRALAQSGSLDILQRILNKELEESPSKATSRAELCADLVAETRKRHADQLPHLIQSMEKYQGSLSILRNFCEEMGTFDIYEATKRAQILRPRKEELISKLRPEQVEKVGANGSERAVARGFHGGLLVGEGTVYLVISPEGLGFPCKRQLLSQIFSVFNPKRFSEELGDDSKTIRQSRVDQLLEEISAGAHKDRDLLKREKKAEKDSPLERRRSLAIEALREELNHYIIEEDLINYGESIIGAEKESRLVLAERGGTMWSWYASELKAGKLPANIKEIYLDTIDAAVTNSDVDLARNARVLQLHYKRNRHIDKTSAFGAFADDFEWYRDLLKSGKEHPVLDPLFDPIRKKTKDAQALPEALQTGRDTELRKLQAGLAKNRAILSNGLDVATWSDVASVLDSFDIVQVRERHNRLLFDKYREECLPVLERLKPLFLTSEGTPHEYCLGDSVPLDTLKRTVYWSTLNREDFKAVMGMLTADMFSVTDKNYYRETSIVNFRAEIERVVEVGRKLKHFDAQLEKLGASDARFTETALRANELMLDAAGVIPVGDEKLGEALKAKQDHFLRGNGYHLVERFQEEHGMSVPELVTRLTSRYPKEETAWSALGKSAKVEIGAGLYSDESLKEMSQRLAWVAQLVPATQLAVEKAQIHEMQQNPLFIGSDQRLKRALKATYLSAEEVGDIQRAADLKSTYDALRLSDSEYVSQLRGKVERLSSTTIYFGAVDNKPFSYAPGVKSIVVNTKSFSNELPHCAWDASTSLRCYDPAKVEQLHGRVEAEFPSAELMAASQLSPEWRKNAEKLFSNEKAVTAVFSQHGLSTPDASAQATIRQLLAGKLTFSPNLAVNFELTRKLHDTIAAVAPKSGSWEQAKEMQPQSGSIAGGQYLSWRDGHVVLNFGRRQGVEGHSILSVARTRSSYIDWISHKKDFPEYLKATAKKALSVVSREITAEQFNEWVAARVKDGRWEL